MENEKISFIPADLTDQNSLRNLLKGKKFDFIFHTASLYDYFAELDVLRKVNVEGTRNLLFTIQETQDLKKLRFIHWSTCGVYGEPNIKEIRKDTQFPLMKQNPLTPQIIIVLVKWNKKCC